MATHTHLRDLITRLARLNAAKTWGDDLNPAQVSALVYLSRANRFSRSPSHVAEYLGTTRGTMSQTLKALERKGYVSEARSETDKRSISYNLTPDGAQVATRSGALEDVIKALPMQDKAMLEGTLSSALLSLVTKLGGRPFGICNTCRHHRQKDGDPYCGLLELVLAPEETTQICNEQRP
jgi:DNA-binding MarR family transcriptional regulator